MLRLGIVLPADHADSALGVLRAHRGVADVVHLRGAAIDPPGDVIEADVAREAADELLDALHPFCAGAGGVVTVTEVAAAVGAPVERAERAAPGEAADAVVWEQIAQRTAEDATFSSTFLVFLIAATLISSVGILTDSDVLVVGGMVLGPEFGPLAAIAVALVHRHGRRALRSAGALLIGFPIAVVVTGLFVGVLGLAHLVPAAYLHGERPLTSFISHPNVFSVVVALIAGVAGMVSLTSAKSGALVGVFISVTTIPAAANIGTAVVTGQLGEAEGAAIQLVVNIASLLVAATATLAVQRTLLRRRRRRGSLLTPSTRRAGRRAPAAPPRAGGW